MEPKEFSQSKGNQQKQDKKDLYCICYERLLRNARGDVVQINAHMVYRHATDRNVAKVEFIESIPRQYHIGRDFRIVEIARALGAFYKQGTEDKLNAVAEID